VNFRFGFVFKVDPEVFWENECPNYKNMNLTRVFSAGNVGPLYVWLQFELNDFFEDKIATQPGCLHNASIYENASSDKSEDETADAIRKYTCFWK